MLKRIPHTYVIVFAIVVLSGILTWIVPGGEFSRETIMVNSIEREVVIPGSFHYTGNNPQTWQVFSALFEGFVDKADIIIFILIIGGSFWIMNFSKSIDVAIYSFLNFSKKISNNRLVLKIGADNIILTFIMLFFSIFGAVFGMSEETIAFVIIFVPLAISMGYDSIVGVSLCFVAAALGFAGAVLNPFTIGIAQGLSDLPLYSGIQYRIFCWFVINIIGFAYILRYAGRIKKAPFRSLVKDDDLYWKETIENTSPQVEYFVPRSAWIMYFLLSLVFIIFSWVYPTTNLSAGESSVNLPLLPVVTLLFIITGYFSLKRILLK